MASGCHTRGWAEPREVVRNRGAGHASQIMKLRELRTKQRLDFVVVSAGFVVGAGGLFKTSFYDQPKRSRLRVIDYNIVDDEPLTSDCPRSRRRSEGDERAHRLGRDLVATVELDILNGNMCRLQHVGERARLDDRAYSVVRPMREQYAQLFALWELLP